MKILDLISDYHNAIIAAGGANPSRLPAATISVLQARLNFQIGPRFHSLYDLSSKPAHVWPEYILEKDALVLLSQINPLETQRLTADKLRFTAHCDKNELPTVPILFLIDNKPNEHSEQYKNATTLEEWRTALNTCPDQIFAKIINGAHGDGAFVAHHDGGTWHFAGQRGTEEDFYNFCMDRLGNRRGWLFQPRISPHPTLSEIMCPGALGTIRAVTHTSSDGARICLPLLRIPAGGNVTDNFSLGSAGNLIAAIDIDSGTLHQAYFSLNRAWPTMKATDTHPDTGARITGRKVPFWNETKKILLNAQAVTPIPRTLGWDIAITADGPKIVEANSLYGTDIFQVAYNRGVRADLTTIISACDASPTQ